MDTRAGATRGPNAADLGARAQGAMILLRGAPQRESSLGEITGMQGTPECAGARRSRRLVRASLMLLGVGACAMRGCGQSASPRARPGISGLLSESRQLVRGRRVDLLYNQTGMDEHGESDIDRLRGEGA